MQSEIKCGIHKKKLQDVINGVLANNDLIKNLTGKLSKKIKDNIGLSMNVELIACDTIPKSIGGKLSRIVDHRKMG